MTIHEELRGPLGGYLLTVIVAGPTLALATAATGVSDLAAADVWPAVLLTALAAVADRGQMHLTHKMQVNVVTAAYVAILLVFPSALPGLLALVATAAGQASLLRTRRDPVEALFNVGQAALYVTVGALCFGAVRDLPHLGPEIGVFGSLGAILVGTAALHLGNTFLITAAAALQLRTNPVRIWLVTLRDDLAAHAAMSALGVVAAQLLVIQPLMVPVLALPVVLVHRALSASVRLREDTHDALAALVEVVELRDPYTAGHSRRVATLARALALRLGLTHEEADLIESAGRVHDVGKVAIAPAVLAKPGKLDAAEWAEMRRHPALGADVVARFAAYGDGHRLVRHHHEAWDGSGYPDALAADAIPLGPRVLAVADTFDALTSARPYRQAMGTDAALRILAQGAGAHWDPRVVAALIDYLGATSPVGVPAPATPVPAPA